MRSVAGLFRHRPWLATAVLVVVAAVAGGGYLLTASSSKATPASGTNTRLVSVNTGTVRQSVTSTGAVEPATQDALTFGASGQVTSVRVSAGQKVQAGQALATINSAALQASLAQARASLASDQARVVADSSAAGTATQIAADDAAVSAAQGQVASAQASLADATLRSPITGVVASVGLSVGQQVSGSGSSGSGSISAGSSGSGTGGTGSSGSGSGTGSTGGGTGSGSGSSNGSASTSADILVLSTDSWIANASVDDTQVGLLAAGEQAQLTVDGTTGTVYGTVASVGMIPSSTTGVASYPVVIAVTGNPPGLHAGASATISLIYKQLSNVLVVPTAAVHVLAGKQVVYEMSGTKQVAHDVTIGLASGGSSQVLTGLASGDQVVVTTTRGTGTSTRTGTGGFGGGGGFGGTGGFGGGGGFGTGGGTGRPGAGG